MFDQRGEVIIKSLHSCDSESSGILEVDIELVDHLGNRLRESAGRLLAQPLGLDTNVRVSKFGIWNENLTCQSTFEVTLIIHRTFPQRQSLPPALTNPCSNGKSATTPANQALQWRSGSLVHRLQRLSCQLLVAICNVGM